MSEEVNNNTEASDNRNDELQRMIKEYDIHNIDELNMDIDRAKKELDEATQKNRNKAAQDAKNRLEDLLKIKEIHEKIGSSKIFGENSVDEVKLNIKEELERGLKKNEIADVRELIVEIKKNESLLNEATERGRIIKAAGYESTLKELTSLLKLSERLNPKFEEQKYVPSKIHDTKNDHLDNIHKNPVNQSNDIENLMWCHDKLPECAEKIIIKLLIFIKQNPTATENEIKPAKELMGKLKSWLIVQKFKEEGMVKKLLHNLKRYFDLFKIDSIIETLQAILKLIRPLNVIDIERLIAKADEAAGLIHGKDIVLIIGETGVGKSTTIHYLAGSNMEKIDVEIEPGKCLEHIQPKYIKNRQLQEVSISPLSKSETRFIKAITIPLQDVLGSHESGEIILCDTPGFGDTAGPEVDIANVIGVIRALKGCKSVKLLVLSSYKGLGDKGQGIRKLGCILVKMIRDITGRLSSIHYAFSKYPESTNVSAILTDIKRNISSDNSLSDENVFVTLLSDMIKKSTKDGAKIYPLNNDPQDLIQAIRRLKGIEFPDEAFQFSLNEDTQSYINRQIERDKTNITNAFEMGNNELVLHYLKNLEKLNTITQQDIVNDAYKDSIRYLVENANLKNKIAMDMFNSAMQHKNGLQQSEIESYKKAIELLKSFESFKEYLESNSRKSKDEFVSNYVFPSSDALILNVLNELDKNKVCIQNEPISNKEIKYYFNNLYILKQNFKEFEKRLNDDFQVFIKRISEYSANVKALIDKINENDSLKSLTENILELYNCKIDINDNFLTEIEENYHNVLNHLLKSLHKHLSKATSILDKNTLDDADLDELKNVFKILEYCKQDQVISKLSKNYIHDLTDNKRNKTFDENEIAYKDSNCIFNLFIGRILKYFNDKMDIIKLELSNGRFENIQRLVKDLDNIRKLPEIEVQTQAKYCNVIEEIQKNMVDLQKDVEKLLPGIDAENCDFKLLAKQMRRLAANGKWLDVIKPGSYEEMMGQIKEDTLNYSIKLQETLSGLDFSLRNPSKLNDANNIMKQVKSMKFLASYIPELQNYIDEMSGHFAKVVKSSFDKIQDRFNLQKNELYQLKKLLAESEKTESELQELHSSNIFLRKNGYQNIEDLENCMKTLIEDIEKAKCEKKNKENFLDSNIKKLEEQIEKYHDDRINKGIENGLNYLRSINVNSIDDLECDKVNSRKEFKEITNSYIIRIAENEAVLNKMKLILDEYKSILLQNSLNENELKFLKEKNITSSNELKKRINELKGTIDKLNNTKQTYVFLNRLNPELAEKALKYVECCENIVSQDIKQIVVDTNGLLKSYIDVYGTTLENDITSKFDLARDFISKVNNYEFNRENLNKTMESLDELIFKFTEFLSFRKFPSVFEIMNGEKKLEVWQQECLFIFANLKHEILGNNRGAYYLYILDIARTLSFIDKVFPTVFSESGFEKLHTTYRGEYNKEAKAIYKTILQHISNGDFANAELQIGAIEDKPISPMDEAQIKHDLNTCLTKLMKETKHTANWLEGKIERQDNDVQIKLITDNIEKILIAQSKQRIIAFIENKETKKKLESFEKEITETLSNVVLKGFKSILHLIETKNFFEAETGIEK